MVAISEKLICYHCGNNCPNDFIKSEENHFCCEGCKLVFEILKENNICNYYTLNEHPGTTQLASELGNRYAFLDDDKLQQQLITFNDGTTTHITFNIPVMHCSSCIWLLENLNRINNGVTQSRVDFLQKKLHVIYNNNLTSLRKIVEQLTSVGYEPVIRLDSLDKKEKKKQNKIRLYRIGVAGFCLGNIMLLSFPEYFSDGKYDDAFMRAFFGWLNLALALPVVLFSAGEFFNGAFHSFKQKQVNIDVAISLGIAAMFIRSAYEILSQTGAGYFDSMSGLVFFTLAGRWFQDKTFESLSFERDFKSYFPIAVSLLKNNQDLTVPIYEIKQGDLIRIRNGEIIPVDGILISDEASIDYSFVTGESRLISKHKGESIFAGGKQDGVAITLSVTKPLNQSYLSQLWNQQGSKHKPTKFEALLVFFSKWFIIITLLIAAAAFLFWLPTDLNKAVNAFTAVLIISCPCAFTLSAPFTFGNMLRHLGKNKMFLKGTTSIYKLADVNQIVFDKTGTITTNNSKLQYTGIDLNASENKLLFALTMQSSHPLSKRINEYLKEVMQPNGIPYQPNNNPENYSEITGSGIQGIINGVFVKIGSAEFLSIENSSEDSTRVYVQFDKEIKGYFELKNKYRNGLEKLIHSLKTKFGLYLLSGDNDSEKKQLSEIFNTPSNLHFSQSPVDKLNFIKQLQQKGKSVLMIGDGLNDSGALMQSDAGLTIADNTNNYTPACDGIIDASKFQQIGNLLKYSRAGIQIIRISFILSLIYNFIGLYFAVTGTLSPVIAAILMPVSTVSLVLFATGTSTLVFKFLFSKSENIQSINQN